MSTEAPFTRSLLLAVCLVGVLAQAEEEPKNVLALETTWHDEAGARTTLAAWKGHWYALTFVYTSCAGTCPLTTRKLKRLDAALDKAHRPLDLVVVSLDPAHDTPEAVKAWRARYQLEDARRWHVLVGEDAQVRTLTMLLNFKYTTNPESGVILHDNAVFLIAPDGSVKTSMSSLDQPLDDFLAAVPRK
jgi:protein SCO1/2